MAATAGAQALDLFLALARLATPPGAERAAADHCRAYLEELGLEVVEDDAAARINGDTGNLYTRLAPTADGTPIFLCAHLDTVPPQVPIDPVIVDGVVTNANPGILGADNKATVAGMLDGVRRVLVDDIPHAGIELVLTAQEEVGLRGAKAFDPTRLTATVGFVYDHAGPLGGIVMAAPGQNTIDLHFIGTAAHAGIAPEQGASAIVAAARAISAMRLGRLDTDTTASVGLITGGTARNIVPAQCDVSAEVRSRDPARLAEETAHVLEVAATGATEAGCGLESSVRGEYAAYRKRRGDRSVALARVALEAAGYHPREEEVGGGADAHVFVGAGLDCLVLTSGMELIHGPDERIRVADVAGLSDITVALVRAAATS